MNEGSIIKSPDNAFIIGFIALSIGYFFGSLWSPDYVDFMNNGYNHLYITTFGIIVLIMNNAIDFYFKKKNGSEMGEKKNE